MLLRSCCAVVSCAMVAWAYPGPLVGPLSGYNPVLVSFDADIGRANNFSAPVLGQISMKYTLNAAIDFVSCLPTSPGAVLFGSTGTL